MKPHASFAELFALNRTGENLIAEGSFGTTVYRAHARSNNTLQPVVAVKCIQLHLLPSNKLREAAQREVEILKQVSHPAILKTLGFFLLTTTMEQEQHKPPLRGREILIVSEYCRGGDLLEQVQRRGAFSERETRRIMRTLCDCLRYLHVEMNIVHRDIKLENLLLRDAAGLDGASVVLIDFGFSRKDSGACRTDCGTRNYASPEMLLGRPYGKAVDIWSLGVCAFTLLAAYNPFAAHTLAQTMGNICAGEIQWQVDEEAVRTWNATSRPCREFIQTMLCVDVAQRATISALCEHAWLVLGE